MEYTFGISGSMETLKVKGDKHANLTGFQKIEQSYPDQIITDHFRIVRKLDSKEDEAGNYYDWYVIDQHSRNIDRSPIFNSFIESFQSMSSLMASMVTEGLNDI